MSKICTTCKEEKPLSKFSKNKKYNDGYQYRCKTCSSTYDRKYRADNPESIKRQQHKWEINNKDKIQAKNRKLYEKGLKEGTSIKGRILLKYQDTPCIDCGGVFPWCAMDFDHRPEETKSFQIGNVGCVLATPTRLAELEKEIAKCDLVCSNCHRVRTKNRMNND